MKQAGELESSPAVAFRNSAPLQEHPEEYVEKCYLYV
jgi:hypothetical protein